MKHYVEATHVLKRGLNTLRTLRVREHTNHIIQTAVYFKVLQTRPIAPDIHIEYTCGAEHRTRAWIWHQMFGSRGVCCACRGWCNNMVITMIVMVVSLLHCRGLVRPVLTSAGVKHRGSTFSTHVLNSKLLVLVSRSCYMPISLLCSVQ